MKNIRQVVCMGITSLIASVMLQSCSSGRYHQPAPAPSYSSFTLDSSVKNIALGGLRSGQAKAGSESVDKFIAKQNESAAGGAKAKIKKTGRLDVDVLEMKKAANSIAVSVKKHHGYMLSLSERETESKDAEYKIMVPSENLDSLIHEIRGMGEVTYQRVWLEDTSEQTLQNEARLKRLRHQRARLSALYNQAKEMDDKIKLEQLISDLDEEIFKIEHKIREAYKRYAYSELTVNLDLKTINGPLGAAWSSTKWGVKKLFILRE